MPPYACVEGGLLQEYLETRSIFATLVFLSRVCTSKKIFPLKMLPSFLFQFQDMIKEMLDSDLELMACDPTA